MFRPAPRRRLGIVAAFVINASGCTVTVTHSEFAMATIPEALATALEYHRAGRLEDAERIYTEILKVSPDHPDALHFLGLAAHQTGRHDLALQHVARAIRLAPGYGGYHNTLGAVYRALGRLDDGVASFRRALQLDPRLSEAHNNLGNALRIRGDADGAVACYQRALELRPDFADAHANLGHAQLDRGETAAAGECYRRALQINATHVEALFQLGTMLLEHGDPTGALEHFQRVVQFRPQYAEAHDNLGNALQKLGRSQEAVDCHRRAVQIRPELAKAHSNLGNALRQAGQLDPAIDSYGRALSLEPGLAETHNNLGKVYTELEEYGLARASLQRALQIEPNRPLWQLRLATLLPTVYASAEEIDVAHRKLLDELKEFADRDWQLELSELLTSGATPPYSVHFHGRDVQPVKNAYADLFRNSFAIDPPKPGSGKPRIGFVVTHKHEDAFLRAMRGILERMNADRFEPVIVCQHANAARIRRRLSSERIGLLVIPDRFDLAAARIREADFDILYHWEPGTDPTNYFLPFLGLAPVQCTSWGIPATSGIAQMDYYLSSELVEPDGADAHYRETLVCARTLLTWHQRLPRPQPARARESFGLSRDAHLYLYAQQLGKLHPDFDTVLGAILRQDAQGTLVIVGDRHGRLVEQLRSRFERTIADVLNRIVFLPFQPFADYLCLTADADVLLDPLHFGGGFSVYDAFSFDKPLVTLPGRFRCGRYAFGCYQLMGIDECVASDPEEYANIAVALGTQPDFRTAVEERIRESSSVLFEDTAAVDEYERIFDNLVQAARSR